MISATENLFPVNFSLVREAAQRIDSYIHHTPLLATRTVFERANMEVLLKCENLQKTGSFKIRGATNAILALEPAAVVAYSSGNHAQAIAYAAANAGIPATIVMPPSSARSKLEATAGYGAKVVTDGVTPSNRKQIAEKIAAESGAVVIPPFDHPMIIAGAGTVALEILEERPDVKTIIAPLGGGGLLAGTCLSRLNDESLTVIGVEPAAGNDGQQSLASGEIVTIEPPDTIADGARTIAIGQLNFQILHKLVSRVVTVDDPTLIETTRWLITRTKLLVEPTGALGLAALLFGAVGTVEPPVAIILSGGNVDLEGLVE